MGSSCARLLLLRSCALTATASAFATNFILPRPTVGRRAFSTTARRMTTSSSSSSPPPLIDVDCNLLHPDLRAVPSSLRPGVDDEDEDVDPVAALLGHPSVSSSSSSSGANIVGVVSPSSTVEEAERSSSSSSVVAGVRIVETAGVHPYHVADEGPPRDGRGALSDKARRLEELVTSTSSRFACVGECGLDYSEGFPPREAQLPWFEFQVDLARRTGLPLFVHERGAFDDLVAVLDRSSSSSSSSSVPVVVHCFTGTRAECAAYVERGYFLSVSGFVRRPDDDGPREVRECLADGTLPLSRLMVETDAPYMGFAGCRDSWLAHHEDGLAALNAKKRKRLVKSIYPNVPSSLPLVVEAATDAINEGRRRRSETIVTTEEVARATTDNAATFFGFDRSRLHGT